MRFASIQSSKMRLLRPRPCCGAYSAPPDLLAGFKEATSRRGGEEEGTGREGKGRRGAGREGRGGEVD